MDPKQTPNQNQPSINTPATSPTGQPSTPTPPPATTDTPPAQNPPPASSPPANKSLYVILGIVLLVAVLGSVAYLMVVNRAPKTENVPVNVQPLPTVPEATPTPEIAIDEESIMEVDTGDPTEVLTEIENESLEL